MYGIGCYCSGSGAQLVKGYLTRNDLSLPWDCKTPPTADPKSLATDPHHFMHLQHKTKMVQSLPAISK